MILNETIRVTCASLFFLFVTSSLRAAVVIDRELPAGNILVERIAGDTVHLSNEMRDSSGWWFYWAFRVTGAEGRTLTFRFTRGGVVGASGPCVSTDRGRTWQYEADSFTPDSFVHTFATGEKETWFAVALPYTYRDWAAFLSRHSADKALFEVTPLCTSRRGRVVDKIRFGCLSPSPKYRVWLTARHHAQESTASFALEGIIEASLAQDELGGWLRKNVAFAAVPLVDRDGVETGDQGKNRKPHDHCRDYSETRAPIYPEVEAIMREFSRWNDGRPLVAIDLHCPGLRGKEHTAVHQVGLPDKRRETAQIRLGKLLERCQSGTLDYRQADDLLFGMSWNTGANYTQGKTMIQWIASNYRSVLGATSFEIPFAISNRAKVTPEACRSWGVDLAKALRLYLEENAK